jgi:phosphomannomutase
LRDVAQSHNSEYFASAVGEVNVVTLMKEKNAVIGVKETEELSILIFTTEETPGRSCIIPYSSGKRK